MVPSEKTGLIEKVIRRAEFDFDMNMPGMQMHRAVTVDGTSSAGRYRAKTKVQMSGDWNARISYDGPKGNGQANFPSNVKT